jgi:hypothetical protein
MENLIPSNCETLAELAELFQSALGGPCVNAFLSVLNNPSSDSDDIGQAIIQRDRCLANLRNIRLSSIMTDPSAPETMDEFEKYVEEYGEDTLHNYNDEPSKQAQFNEWKIGCGSAPELLWLKGEICSCDCKKTYYLENGVIKEDDSFYIQPEGKSPELSENVFGQQRLNIVINGKMVERNLITSGQEYQVRDVGIPEEESIAGNLQSKLFFTSGQRKRQFLLARTV